MKVSIQDKKALLAVSPAALSAYARTSGWTKSIPTVSIPMYLRAKGCPRSFCRELHTWVITPESSR